TIAKKKLPKEIFERKDKNGFTILHLAVLEGSTDVVSALLKAGANPNVKDREGKTPLHYAVINASDLRSNTAKIEVLLKAGADPNAQDKYGNTPLHYIFAKDLYLEKFKLKNIVLLLKYGANPNIKNNKGETPLTLFLAKLPEDSRLAEKYNYIDWKTKDPSPLLLLVSLYIKGGADINLPNGEGKYPLDIVLEKEIKAEDYWRSALSKLADILIKQNGKVSYQNLGLYFLHKGENVYNLAYLFKLKGKYPEYKNFFDEQIQKGVEKLTKLLSTGKVEYIKLGNNVSIKESLTIPITTKVYFVILGEKGVGSFDQFFGKSSWRDYGYIVSYTGEKYPSFETPIYAGGDARNSVVYEDRTLTAGLYTVVVKTNNSHSYGSWKGEPPDIVNPQNWGLQVVFPNIGKDTLFTVKSILTKYPNTKHKSKLLKLLSLAKVRANKEERDKKLFKAVENRDLHSLIAFIKRYKDNIYRPKAEALAVKKDFEYTAKYIAMSKLVLTQGRLLPPSESLADKIAKYFGLPPTDYGEDEVVVRGANVEFRGRNVYISGIIQNKGSKTVNVNLLGLFQFKTIKETKVLLFFGGRNTSHSFRWDIFKIPNLRPKEKRAFTFKLISGKGSGVNLGLIGRSVERTFLEKYDVLPYVSVYFRITPEERARQVKLLKEVGLYNVNLSKVNVGKIKDLVSASVKGSTSYSTGNNYTIVAVKNASVEVVRDGGGNQVDIVPRDLCSDHNFVAITSAGQKNTDPYNQLDFPYVRFPITITVRYKGGCGIFGGSGKDVYVKLKINKQGAYRVFIYPR
ncbi:MAG: ankyrin repeat domain-containing protein, partial [Aquificae bacterium]|nr:ankyrin repeat domain-containing protein [Aquificota bacterium]